VLLLCGAIAKKLVRGTGWEKKDFFLGVELTLAAMSSGMLYIFELVQPPPSTTQAALDPNKILYTGLFLVVCFFLLLWVLSTHQDWERRTGERGQVARLMFFS